MEVLWFAYVAGAVGILSLWGAYWYRRGKNAKKLIIESLSFKQAMKWWAVHELIRHEDDKRQIRSDLRKLMDVQMPQGTEYNLWVDIHGNPKVKG